MPSARFCLNPSVHGRIERSAALIAILAAMAMIAFGAQRSVAAAASNGEKPAATSTTEPAYQPRTRHYYIAAEDVRWNYAPSGENKIKPHMNMADWGEKLVYDKTVYVQYTDETFTEKVPQPLHLGIVGPVIRCVVGDKVEIHFKNNAASPYSIHPVGTSYDKASEGASYGGLSFPGQSVAPGETYTYKLDITPESGPGPEDPSSILRLYRSHVKPVEDVYRGLAGPIIITRAEDADEDGRPTDVDREFVCEFLVFNENTGDEEKEGDLMHAINGYVFGNQPGLTMQQGERVRWYLFGMGSEVDMHTPHWHGNGVVHEGRRKEVLMLLPTVSIVADMNANNPGRWLFKCNIGDHVHAGMMSLYTVEPATGR